MCFTAKVRAKLNVWHYHRWPKLDERPSVTFRVIQQSKRKELKLSNLKERRERFLNSKQLTSLWSFVSLIPETFLGGFMAV